jgi:hypothetical protein
MSSIVRRDRLGKALDFYRPLSERGALNRLQRLRASGI